MKLTVAAFAIGIAAVLSALLKSDSPVLGETVTFRQSFSVNYIAAPFPDPGLRR